MPPIASVPEGSTSLNTGLWVDISWLYVHILDKKMVYGSYGIS